MDFLNSIDDYFGRLKIVLDNIDKDKINYFVSVLLKHYEKQSCIYIFGNGGSAMTASHVVCDFNKGVCLELEKKFKLICLNDNLATILAYANDISYDEIFRLQLKNYLKKDDLVIGISGSGNSLNVLEGIEYSKQVGAETFTLCGFDGGKLKQVDAVNCLHIPINDMQIAEDSHVIIFHVVMQILYKHLNNKAK